jgi:hypothetical protein
VVDIESCSKQPQNPQQEWNPMRNLLLTSVAVTALLAGLATAGAQGSRDRNNPSATEQSQPRARGDNKVKVWPGSRGEEDEKQGQARSESQRSTTGQATTATQERSAQPADSSGDTTQRQRAEDRAKRSEQRNERAEDRAKRSEQRNERAQDRANRAEQRNERAQDRATTRTEQQSRTTQRGSITLSDDQRTRISARFSDRIDRMNVRSLSRSTVSVSVGATVPRSVRLHVVPSDIVAIYPRFRGHRFVVVEDEIVIVEPRGHRIVAVLPMGGERRAARAPARETTGATAAGSRIRLSQEDRTLIRTTVLREPACRLEQRVDFFLFVPIPRTVEVCQLPAEVVSRVPAVGSYRYVVRGDEVALVDPEEYRIVEVIR